MSEEGEKYLVLCVDRDNDLGRKGRIKTPVVGRDAALAAATKLALADPEEADANAIFAAVKKLDELTRDGNKCEVAVVSGDSDRGFRADRKLSREISEVLKSSEADGVVLVSDGGEDELVIPIIQSHRPIASVHRVTVKHSQTVEETYEVLGRYLRMLVFDPHYSKYALGVPGLIFVLAGVFILAGRTIEAELASLMIIGGALLVRGFSVDRTVAGFLHRGPTGFLRLFSLLAAIIVILVGIVSGYNLMMDDAVAVNAIAADPSALWVYGATLIGYLIRGSIDLVWAGIAIYASGALLSHVARDSPRWTRDALVLVMLGILYFPVQTFSQFLISGTAQSTILLISAVLIGLAAIFALTSAVYPRVRTRVISANG